MTDRSYGFCKSFVNTSDPAVVLAVLSDALGGITRRRGLELPGLSVDIRTNPDVADPRPGDDFVRWPVIVEIEADDATGEAIIVTVASQVLATLWEAGYPTVTACDFEDELPWEGGIARLGQP